MLKSIVAIFIIGFLLLVCGDSNLNINSGGYKDNPPEPQCIDSNAVLCEEVVTYPYDNLVDILKTSNKIPLEILNQYQEEDEQEDSLCYTVTKFVVPQAGYTRDGTRTFIVNHSQLYQKVKVTTCSRKDSSCKYVDSVAGFEWHCEQSYTYERLYALDTSFNLTAEFFKIPSGCYCMTNFICNDMV